MTVCGVIVAVRGRFLATKELGEWVYDVHLDVPFCGSTLWNLPEKKLTPDEETP